VKVLWTATARKQLQSIHDYISQDSELYAQRMVDRLTRRSEQIAAFPASGRMVPEMEVPEIRQVIEGPYRLIYLIKPDGIDVLAVIHGAQQAPWGK
jgi:toxin ParE1/3/4